MLGTFPMSLIPLGVPSWEPIAYILTPDPLWALREQVTYLLPNQGLKLVAGSMLVGEMGPQGCGYCQDTLFPQLLPASLALQERAFPGQKPHKYPPHGAVPWWKPGHSLSGPKVPPFPGQPLPSTNPRTLLCTPGTDEFGLCFLSKSLALLSKIKE